MISLVCIDSKLLNNNNWYGRFQLAPFRKSEGLTIANALRRTLLAEKSNFLISWVDFYNAEIPYSVLTGMRESIFDILLNLKQIILTSEINISQNFEAVDSPKNFQNNHLSSSDNFQWDRMQNEFLISKQREKQLPKRNQTCWTNNFSFSPFFGQNKKDSPKKKFILLSRLSYVPSSMQNREKLPTNQSIFGKKKILKNYNFQCKFLKKTIQKKFSLQSKNHNYNQVLIKNHFFFKNLKKKIINILKKFKILFYIFSCVIIIIQNNYFIPKQKPNLGFPKTIMIVSKSKINDLEVLNYKNTNTNEILLCGPGIGTVHQHRYTRHRKAQSQLAVETKRFFVPTKYKNFLTKEGMPTMLKPEYYPLDKEEKNMLQHEFKYSKNREDTQETQRNQLQKYHQNLWMLTKHTGQNRCLTQMVILIGKTSQDEEHAELFIQRRPDYKDTKKSNPNQSDYTSLTELVEQFPENKVIHLRRLSTDEYEALVRKNFIMPVDYQLKTLNREELEKLDTVTVYEKKPNEISSTTTKIIRIVAHTALATQLISYVEAYRVFNLRQQLTIINSGIPDEEESVLIPSYRNEYYPNSFYSGKMLQKNTDLGFNPFANKLSVITAGDANKPKKKESRSRKASPQLSRSSSLTKIDVPVPVEKKTNSLSRSSSSTKIDVPVPVEKKTNSSPFNVDILKNLKDKFPEHSVGVMANAIVANTYCYDHGVHFVLERFFRKNLLQEEVWNYVRKNQKINVYLETQKKWVTEKDLSQQELLNQRQAALYYSDILHAHRQNLAGGESKILTQWDALDFVLCLNKANLMYSRNKNPYQKNGFFLEIIVNLFKAKSMHNSIRSLYYKISRDLKMTDSHSLALAKTANTYLVSQLKQVSDQLNPKTSLNDFNLDYEHCVDHYYCYPDVIKDMISVNKDIARDLSLTSSFLDDQQNITLVPHMIHSLKTPLQFAERNKAFIAEEKPLPNIPDNYSREQWERLVIKEKNYLFDTHSEDNESFYLYLLNSGMSKRQNISTETLTAINVYEHYPTESNLEKVLSEINKTNEIIAKTNKDKTLSKFNSI